MLKTAAAELDRRKADPSALIHYYEIASTAVAGAADAPPEREARQHCVDEVCRYLLCHEEPE